MAATLFREPKEDNDLPREVINGGVLGTTNSPSLSLPDTSESPTPQ